MISVSDLLKILDNIPIWKRLKNAPQRIDDLEQRLERLEKSLTAKPTGKVCPSCGQRTLRLVASKRDSTMGDVGGVRRDYKCQTCGWEDKDMLEFPGQPNPNG